MYVNCQTTLIDSFRSMYPREFKFEGNRAIVFEESDVVPAGQLSSCIEVALTYHRDKGRSARSRRLVTLKR